MAEIEGLDWKALEETLLGLNVQSLEGISVIIFLNKWGTEGESAQPQGWWPMPELQKEASMLVIRDMGPTPDSPIGVTVDPKKPNQPVPDVRFLLPQEVQVAA